eukprot:188214_1
MALEPLQEHKFENGEMEAVDNVIDWGIFTKSLSKVVGEGIECVMVLSCNGTLLSSFGVKSKSAKRIIPPLLTSIWKITSNVGKNFVAARGLELMFVNCKLGRIAISIIPDDIQPYFVCLLAQNEMELGLLKVKLELITDQLAKILFNEEDDDDEDDVDNNDEIAGPSTEMQEPNTQQ